MRHGQPAGGAGARVDHGETAQLEQLPDGAGGEIDRRAEPYEGKRGRGLGCPVDRTLAPDRREIFEKGLLESDGDRQRGVLLGGATACCAPGLGGRQQRERNLAVSQRPVALQVVHEQIRGPKSGQLSGEPRRRDGGERDLACDAHRKVARVERADGSDRGAPCSERIEQRLQTHAEGGHDARAADDRPPHGPPCRSTTLPMHPSTPALNTRAVSPDFSKSRAATQANGGAAASESPSVRLTSIVREALQRLAARSERSARAGAPQGASTTRSACEGSVSDAMSPPSGTAATDRRSASGRSDRRQSASRRERALPR